MAREIATHLGTDHHELIVRADAVNRMPMMIQHLGEPMADNSIMPTFYVSEFARTQVTVALTGDGGDESFAGYRRFYQIRRAQWLAQHGLTPLWRGLRRSSIALEAALKPSRKHKRFPASRADEILGMQGVDGYKHLLAFYSDTEKAGILSPDLHAAIGQSRTTQYLAGHLSADGDDLLNRYLKLEINTYLPEDILFKVDIASMANSLECRSPFLDHELVEFAFSLPGHYKLSTRGRHKHILKEAFKDWLPVGFMDRPKKGFSVPLGRWLREDLSDRMRDVLVDRARLSPWFKQTEITRYVDEHLAGRQAHSTRLWPLLVLAQWVDQFNVQI
jgi:asparagine synthase (glutamine-hydrolysing)